MFCRNTICTLAALMLFASGLLAQSGKLRSAKKSMDDLDYISAIAQYQQILQRDEIPEAVTNLAECYRKINDTENAEYWYGQVVRLPEATAFHNLYYGMMLQANGKCDLAREWYDKFTTAMPDDARGGYLARACEYEDELMTKNAGIYEITHAPFNSNLDDFYPTIFKDKVVFASDRDKGSAVKRVHMWTGNPFSDLYAVNFKEKDENPASFQYGRPDKYDKNLNSKFHEAGVSYSPDGDIIYFTRNNYLGGKLGKDDENIVRLKIYYGSSKGEDNWANLESLPFNSDEYSVAHPALSADGEKIYFASDMPGGFGGMDLYVSEKEGSNWGPPINLGPIVNTEGNEAFPYMDKSGRLYYASDGLIGLGGLDIYYSTEKAMNEWNVPVNLGYPINTNNDDFGITFGEDGTWGFLTSDREGGAGRDDIYAFKKTAAPVEIFVYDAMTNEPIKDANVLFSMNENIYTTGADGKATLDMKLNECADFTASFEGYEDNKVEGCTVNIPSGEKVVVSIPMKQVIQFDLEGIVFDDQGMPTGGAKVKLMNDCGQPEQEFLTDETGRYRFELTQGCCYTVKAEKEGYIADKEEGICTKELSKKTTLQANLDLMKYKQSPTGDAITGVNPTNTSGTGSPSTPQYSQFMSKEGDPIPASSAPKYNRSTGLYENPDGTPFEGSLSGNTIREGVMYDGNGNVLKPGDVPFDVIETVGANGEVDGNFGFLLNIYYDFNRATLRDESEEELNKVMTMLIDNPEFIVEIASHTDSRGSDGYNAALSQRRANSVVKWLTDRGISRDRLIPVGYGETQLTNNCRNRVRCSEKEHQLNRRTEFRVLGCRGGSDIQISKPKVNPRTVPCKNCPF